MRCRSGGHLGPHRTGRGSVPSTRISIGPPIPEGAGILAVIREADAIRSVAISTAFCKLASFTY